jgi:hypothetical protein
VGIDIVIYTNVVVAPKAAGVEGLGSGKRQRASGDLHDGIYQSPQIHGTALQPFFLQLLPSSHSPSQGILLDFSFWVVDPAVSTVSRRRLFS